MTTRECRIASRHRFSGMGLDDNIDIKPKK